jgi:hypothetical protein
MTDTSAVVAHQFRIQKISKILEDKHDLIAKSLWEELDKANHGGENIYPTFNTRFEELWVEFLNRIDCTIITHEDIREDFEGIINYSSRGKVCVPTHFANNCPYVLMHEELAEKILILGGVPDSWFPESILSQEEIHAKVHQ